MIDGHIDENEKRRSAALTLDQPQRLIVKEMIGLEIALYPHLFQIDKVFDAGGRLEHAGAKEGAIERIKAERLVAAPSQRLR